MDKRRSTAFTLVELLLVMVVVMGIGTFSVVFFSRFLMQNAVVDTQDRLVGQLRKAQMYAMMGKRNGSWGVHFGSNKITLFQGASYAARDVSVDEIFTENANVNISGFTEVIFSKTSGLPSSTGSYTIAGGDTSKQVIINLQGVVSR